MVIIGKYNKTDELINIWKECYDDTLEYIDFFMKNMSENVKEAVYLIDNKAVGVMYLIPCMINNTGEKAFYWYAGGVIRKYRKRGVFSELVDAILQYSDRTGYKSFCYAMPQMREFYKNKGLVNEYYKSNTMIKKSGNNCNISRRKLKKGEYLTLREEYFSGINYIEWNKKYLDYAAEEKRICGGIGDIITIEDKPYAVIGDIKDGILYIEETTIEEKVLCNISDSLCNMYNADGICVQTPINNDYMVDNVTEEYIYSAMGNIESNDLYVSLTLL